MGVGAELLRDYFGTSVSTIGGIGLKEVAHDCLAFHQAAWSEGEVIIRPVKKLPVRIACPISVSLHIAREVRNTPGHLR